jgi:aspartate carbamoyltransferase regulatory subunit
MTRPNDFRLEHGTVIDHLPVGTAVRALELLRVPRSGAVTVGINVPSRRYGRKDIVRVEGLELQKPELDRLALLGRSVTVSIVKSGDVAGKVVLEVPRRLEGLLKCPNPTCITNHERTTSCFERLGEFPYRFKCVYCERVTGAGKM